LVIDTADRLGFSGDEPHRIASLTYVVDGAAGVRRSTPT
jgi:hypothetical protein